MRVKSLTLCFALSRHEFRFREFALVNDAFECAPRNLCMIWDRDRYASIRKLAAHNYVTAGLADFREPMLFQITQTFLAERICNLGMSEFQSHHLHATIQAPLNLGLIGFLKQERNGFVDQRLGLLEGSPLARDSKLRTCCDVPLSFLLDHGS